MGRDPTIDDVTMAALMIASKLTACEQKSLYFFHKSEHTKAWRLTSLASRICFELCLHQAPEEAQKAVETSGSFSPRMLFCCVYVLDRTFSFATDLPHTTKDEDIDERCFDLQGYLVSIPSREHGIYAPQFGDTRTVEVFDQERCRKSITKRIQRLRDQFRDLTAALRSTTLPSNPWDPL
ncbi:hypothetical protein CEK26_011589 [Fusarium fujikuroi]|uniref:Xylanolytic transcriptional activator regulatory domain-containing protein n=1 Tax=Fusarium fujikuroi TaxID=5127 RepID=A0A5Q3DL39_FUSFU|nr:hypothetical protein CEK27_011607 [Fusarium fujikuroi]QGI84865.1 hypothetical protein CEK25_011594 [Fusarium fujikuroi]QGI98520.1 hypothetical protein CEK26_011589 [Fusarium fujikuroi]VTT58251.1 unnamed protein product [Fusarium fujikuroi]VZI14815.1 unnamed protein product [Fusarium fujikuroi]